MFRNALAAVFVTLFIYQTLIPKKRDNIPLPRIAQRETPLHFGLYVMPDPENNPIDPPERFEGYHTAIDYEIFEDEQEKRVPVRAVCSGEIIFSAYAEGYGGTIVHPCTVKDEPVTVLYGHLLLSALPRVGTMIRRGDVVGELAPAYSYDSGETRKHLHLGIHRTEDIELRGYVLEEELLQEWFDPESVL